MNFMIYNPFVYQIVVHFGILILYHESVFSLRESVICALNGQFRASFASLRSFLESWMFHYKWRSKFIEDKNFYEFYDWLLGKTKHKENIRNVFEKNYDELDFSCSDDEKKKFFGCYRRLCSFSHKANLYESPISKSGTSLNTLNADIIKFWLEMLNESLGRAIRFSILYDPVVLFPVDLVKKFGFNWPAFLFLDKYSYFVIKQFLGENETRTLRAMYKEKEKVNELLNFYRSYKDLSREDVIKTWPEVLTQDEKNMTYESLHNHLYIKAKSKLRVIDLSSAYNKNIVPIEGLFVNRDTK